MAPELVWDELPSPRRRLRVLDPMAGSGTTLVVAKLQGHEAIGYDRDPLAVLIARAWLTGCEPMLIESKAAVVLARARSRVRGMKVSEAYPRGADEETRAFVRYWFDNTNRFQLAALSEAISRLRDPLVRDLMWCAFSRLIITKTVGVSLAMDVSHSRPHRSYEKAPINAFDRFQRSVRQLIALSPFLGSSVNYPVSSMGIADARELPIENDSIDVVITSPPYLNAIDYLRGHKFSLIWMGYSLEALRSVRATNVGTEISSGQGAGELATGRILEMMCRPNGLSNRHAGMLRRYVRDMRAVLSEAKRVLRPGGKAVLVVGNCNLRDTFVRNSKCVEGLAGELGMLIKSTRSRLLPENRRYLPPPALPSSGKALRKRMREEVILTLLKR